MQADPIGEVGGLYRWLGADLSEAFESRMRQWSETNAATREASRPSDPAIYGLDLDLVRPRFAAYVTRARRWTRR
jgi:hypothetical protein